MRVRVADCGVDTRVPTRAPTNEKERSVAATTIVDKEKGAYPVSSASLVECAPVSSNCRTRFVSPSLAAVQRFASIPNEVRNRICICRHNMDSSSSDMEVAYIAEARVVDALIVEAEERRREIEQLKKALDCDGEVHEQEIRCKTKELRARRMDLEHRLRLKEAEVQALRLQSDERERLDDENDSMRKELEEIVEERNEAGRKHAASAHEMQSGLLRLRRQLESSFQQELSDIVQTRYEKAFGCLDTEQRRALVEDARLREEAMVQRMGVDAVTLRQKIQAEELAASRSEIERLRRDQDACAVAAARTRRDRDASLALAGRLEQTYERFRDEEKGILADSDAMILRFDNASTLVRSDTRSLRAQRDVLRQLERKVKQLSARIDAAKRTNGVWEERAEMMRSLSSEDQKMTKEHLVSALSLGDDPSLRGILVDEMEVPIESILRRVVDAWESETVETVSKMSTKVTHRPIHSTQTTPSSGGKSSTPQLPRLDTMCRRTRKAALPRRQRSSIEKVEPAAKSQFCLKRMQRLPIYVPASVSTAQRKALKSIAALSNSRSAPVLLGR